MSRSAIEVIRKYHPNVQIIEDAKSSISIEVTDKDCHGARQRSPAACAIARALSRENDGAVVGISRLYVINGKRATRYMLPESTGREIALFDRHADFNPGEYRARAPSKSQRLGNPRNRTHKKGTSKHNTKGIRKI
jgi:hypothetical protein